jgi:Protein kinase domain/Domain of unknown function (DUF4384)
MAERPALNDDPDPQFPSRVTADDPNATRLLSPTPPPALDGDFLPVGWRLEEFEIRGRLGQGGFSVVYSAWDHELQHSVALKEYMPSSIARRAHDGGVTLRAEADRTAFDIGLDSFVKEGRTLVRFNHPALVRVFRTFRAHGTAYMVMQLVQGRTLESVLRDLPGPPDEAWVRALLDPLTRALQVVHGEDIVHRDIAPDNVMMLQGSGQPLLLDFGAARRVIGAQDRDPTAMLKPSYAPVEQFPDSGLQQGAHTDVYALAATLHRVLTGAAPQNAQSRAVRDVYEPLATRLAGRFSPGLLRAIDRALALDPRDRTPTIAAFRAELGLDAPGPAAAARPGPPTAGGQARRTVWLAVGAGLLAAAGGAAWWWADAPAAAPTPAAPDTNAPPTGTPRAAPSALPVPAAWPAPTDTGQGFEAVLQAAAPELRPSLSVETPALKIDATPLRLRLTSPIAGYFHVLLHDTDGQVRVLFPHAGAARQHIDAGETLGLPASGTDHAMVFSEPAGPARLLAVVSPTPLSYDTITQRMDGDHRLLVQGAALAAAQAQQPDRPVYAGQAICTPGVPCDARFGAAEGRFEVLR